MREFKAMVKALHRAGLEVILDVVYDHTAEGDHLGPTLSLRGIDNPAYYRLVPEGLRFYRDYTGCGNTLDLRQPRALQLVMDSLRRTSATVLAHAASRLKRPARRVTGGTVFELGTKTVTVIDAPGHTPDSLAEVPDHAEVVVVCRTSVRATIAAEVLARAGHRPRVLEGGMTAWRRARLPVREGRKRLAVDRQVQLIAGVMVLTGVTLGTLVNPWFLAIAAFFGAGLTFAGATGTCGLALLLLKTPWNRPLPVPSDGSVAACAAGGGATGPCAAPASPRN